MRLINYVKTTLRAMISNISVTLLFYIGFPLLLAGLMGFMQKSLFENPLKLETIEIKIVDEDKSTMSSQMINFLKSDELKQVINIEPEDDKYAADIIIPKGYERAIMDGDKNPIVIKEKDSSDFKLKTLKSILDRYHENIYLSSSGGSLEDLGKIYSENSIITKTVEKERTINSYEYYSSSMVSFVFSMLMYGVIISSFMKPSLNLEKRMMSMPLSKATLFNYNFIAYLIYALILVGGYIGIYRISGISFKGDLGALLLISISSCLLIVSVSYFIIEIFKEKLAKVIAFILFMTPIIGGGIFTNTSNKLAVLSPTYYISKTYENYVLTGGLQGSTSYILGILTVGILLYGITLGKTIIVRRKSI